MEINHVYCLELAGNDEFDSGEDADIIGGVKLRDIACEQRAKDGWCCTKKELRQYCFPTEKSCLNYCLGTGFPPTPQTP